MSGLSHSVHTRLSEHCDTSVCTYSSNPRIHQATLPALADFFLASFASTLATNSATAPPPASRRKTGIRTAHSLAGNSSWIDESEGRKGCYESATNKTHKKEGPSCVVDEDHSSDQQHQSAENLITRSLLSGLLSS